MTYVVKSLEECHVNHLFKYRTYPLVGGLSTFLLPVYFFGLRLWYFWPFFFFGFNWCFIQKTIKNEGTKLTIHAYNKNDIGEYNELLAIKNNTMRLIIASVNHEGNLYHFLSPNHMFQFLHMHLNLSSILIKRVGVRKSNLHL